MIRKIKVWAVVAPNGNLDSVQDIYECKQSAEICKRFKKEYIGKIYKVIPCEIRFNLKYEKQV